MTLERLVGGVAVRVEGLSRRYKTPLGEVWALRDVSLSVAEGECLGIVGESGSGKSTLARLLVGLDTPTSGIIEVCGLKVDPRAKRSERLRHARLVQLVFQDPSASLNPRLTAGESIGEPLVIHSKLTRADRRRQVARLLQRVGLPTDVADCHPNTLSGGQRQRVAIARAIALKPRVLVLDEPVSALDVSIRAHILNLIQDVAAEHGIATLFVGHDLSVVRWLASRVAVLLHGEVVELGTTAQVLGAPAHPFTRQLVGAELDPLATRVRVPEQRDLEPGPRLASPTGCVHAARCALAQPACLSVRPRLAVLASPAGGQLVACHDAHGFRDVGQT